MSGTASLACWCSGWFCKDLANILSRQSFQLCSRPIQLHVTILPSPSRTRPGPKEDYGHYQSDHSGYPLSNVPIILSPQSSFSLFYARPTSFHSGGKWSRIPCSALVWESFIAIGDKLFIGPIGSNNVWHYQTTRTDLVSYYNMIYMYVKF